MGRTHDGPSTTEPVDGITYEALLRSALVFLTRSVHETPTFEEWAAQVDMSAQGLGIGTTTDGWLTSIWADARGIVAEHPGTLYVSDGDMAFLEDYLSEDDKGDDH